MPTAQQEPSDNQNQPMKLKLMICLSLCLLPLSVSAQDEPQKFFDTVALYWENDSFMGTDRDYTNGLKLTWRMKSASS